MNNFGPRTSHITAAAKTPKSRPTNDSIPASPKMSLLRVADSELLVAKSWLLGSDLSGLITEMGGKVRMTRHDWSEHLLERCDEGDIDIAIFNTEAAFRYCERNSDNKLWVSPSFARSMGGRNFAMIVTSNNPLLGQTAQELRENLSDVTIYVGKDTDRYQNLLLILGIDNDSWWESRNIRIVNIPDPRLDTLETEPEAILVTGQNRRYEAYLRADCDELLSYESLEPAICNELRKRASNSMIFGSKYDRRYGEPEQLVSTLMGRFRSNTCSEEFVKDLIEELVDECEFTTKCRNDRCMIARHVLYETYQIGEPVW